MTGGPLAAGAAVVVVLVDVVTVEPRVVGRRAGAAPPERGALAVTGPGAVGVPLPPVPSDTASAPAATSTRAATTHTATSSGFRLRAVTASSAAAGGGTTSGSRQAPVGGPVHSVDWRARCDAAAMAPRARIPGDPGGAGAASRPSCPSDPGRTLTRMHPLDCSPTELSSCPRHPDHASSWRRDAIRATLAP